MDKYIILNLVFNQKKKYKDNKVKQINETSCEKMYNKTRLDNYKSFVYNFDDDTLWLILSNF
jgi:hypothetical protein